MMASTERPKYRQQSRWLGTASGFAFVPQFPRVLDPSVPNEDTQSDAKQYARAAPFRVTKPTRLSRAKFTNCNGIFRLVMPRPHFSGRPRWPRVLRRAEELSQRA